MSDSEEEYGPLPTTWGSQVPSTTTTTDADSQDDDNPKGWDSLLDPDFAVGPKGLGSGNLHRRGRNFIPLDEEVILAQRLNKPLPKKSRAKKPDGIDVEGSSSKSTTHKTTKPSKSKKKLSKKTADSSNEVSQLHGMNEQSNNNTLRKPQIVSSSRSIPTSFTAPKRTKNNAAPPELSTIRAPPQNTSSTGWGNATLVETPFWATETNGSNGSKHSEENNLKADDTMTRQVNTNAINSHGAKETNGVATLDHSEKKMKDNWGDKFQSAMVDHKRRSIEEKIEKNQITRGGVSPADTDNNLNDWTFSDQSTGKGTKVRKEKKDSRSNEDGRGIWDIPKSNGSGWGAATNSSANNGGWNTSGWSKVSTATPVAITAADDVWNQSSTTATNTNIIPSDASASINSIPNEKKTPTPSFTDPIPLTPYNEDDWTNSYNNRNTSDDTSGWSDNNYQTNSTTTGTPYTDINEKPRFSDPTRQKYSELRKGPRNKPLNYQRNGRIPIIPTVTAPPPPPENALLVTINVELSDTFKTAVEIHELDDPTDLATQFGQKHNIQQPKIIDALTRLFSSQKELALKKKNRVLKRTIPSQKQLREKNPFFYQPHAENTAYQRMAATSAQNQYSSSAYASTFHGSKGIMSLPASTPPLPNRHPIVPSSTSTFTRKQYY